MSGPVQIGNASLYLGDCLATMAELEADSVDSCVCDPPYHLQSIVKRFANSPRSEATENTATPYGRTGRGFMGQKWDGGDIAFRPETWAAVFRILKPGAHLIAFSGTRTYHRMVCAIEDAGFEIRDQLAWCYGSGFPKSHDVSKQIDKMAGGVRRLTRPGAVQRDGYGDDWDTGSSQSRPRYDEAATPEGGQWQGWGTALKPAWEPICLARKPLVGTVAANVLEHGTGALNIDACRVGTEERENGPASTSSLHRASRVAAGYRHDDGVGPGSPGSTVIGRWPANIIHDGSEEVMAHFPETGVSSGGRIGNAGGGTVGNIPTGQFSKGDPGFGDSGSAARFFKSADISEEESLLYRAKAMLSAWNSELANTADSTSNLSEQVAAFALSGVATWALRAGRLSSDTIILSTSVTPSELRRISESFIAAILIFESASWLEWRHARLIPNGSHVQFAEIREPTDTTTITISHWRSNGSAEPVTFSITPLNLGHGARGLASDKRFIYCAKTSAAERHAGCEDLAKGNAHPTVKPIELMRYLTRLVTPKGGLVLDPFAGSGSTLIAASWEGFHSIGCELSPEYLAIAERRLTAAQKEIEDSQRQLSMFMEAAE